MNIFMPKKAEERRSHTKSEVSNQIGKGGGSVLLLQSVMKPKGRPKKG
jgi:hypothetical protein